MRLIRIKESDICALIWFICIFYVGYALIGEVDLPYIDAVSVIGGVAFFWGLFAYFKKPDDIPTYRAILLMIQRR